MVWKIFEEGVEIILIKKNRLNFSKEGVGAGGGVTPPPVVSDWV